MPGGSVIYRVDERLYVSEDGDLQWNRPGVTVVGEALPEATAVSLTPSLHLLGGEGDGPVTGDPRYQGPKLSIEVAEKTYKMLEAGVSVATKVFTVVGIADALVQIVELSGVFGKKADLDDVLEYVKLNYRATIEASKLSHLRDMAEPDSTVSTTKILLETHKAIPSAQSRKNLVDHELKMVGAVQELLNPAYQQILMNGAEYSQHPWWMDSGFLTITPAHRDAATRLHERYPNMAVQPIARFAEVPDGTGRFDYRFAIGSIVAAVVTRLMMMKVLEPEFRSTGRYQAELRDIALKLRTVQYHWLQSIQCTRSVFDRSYEGGEVNDMPTWDYYQTFFPPPYIPVAAVDICSGLGEVSSVPIGPIGPYDQPYLQPSFGDKSFRAAKWMQAASLRETARQNVLRESGYANFLGIIALVEEMAKPPSASETVVISEGAPPFTMHAQRLTEVEEGSRTTGGLICPEREFPVEVVQSPGNPTAVLMIRTQSPESLDTFEIAYAFRIASGGALIDLSQGEHTVTVRLRRFIAQVGPAGEERNEDLPPQDTAVTYVLDHDASAGHATLRLEIPAGVNARVHVQVAETIQSGDLFITNHEVELVSRLERLPSEYFTYVAECRGTQNGLLTHINDRFALSRDVRLPGFDPRRERPNEYLANLQENHWDVLMREINAINRFR